MRFINLFVYGFLLTITFTGITSAAVPSQAETPMETPTATPTPLQPTHTPVPNLVPYQIKNNRFSVSQFYSINGNPLLLSTNPNTGQIAFVLNDRASVGNNRGYSLYYVNPTQESPMNAPTVELEASLEFDITYGLSLVDMSIDENNAVYILNVHFGPQPAGTVTAIMPDQSVRTWFPFNYGRAIYVVKSTDNIPNTIPGDVLVLNWELDSDQGLTNVIYKINPRQEGNTFEIFLGPEALPQGVPIADMNIGVDNQLFFLTKYIFQGFTDTFTSKLLYLQEDKTVREWVHQDMNINTNRLEFFSTLSSFFISGGSQLYLTSEDKRTLPVIEEVNLWDYLMTASNDHETMYFVANIFNNSQDSPKGLFKLERLPIQHSEPTATPSAPTPTPTPIAGWLVLDGFGGIHQSNLTIPRPVLPYFGWNIIRDIEPDPLGRGWYMLDGFGGIHTSSPEMPKPFDLPYFGFDIARNLEVKQDVRGGYHFYLLDGYGGVHTNNPVFDYGSLPFFGFDAVRDFEPVRDNAWMTMDMYGNTYENFGYFRDKITYAHPSSFHPIMRGMVRFPDDTKVMIDHFAGLHTNPFHPAWDKANGLPDGFYFPGFDIIWDIEVIPQNFTGN